MGFCYIGRDKTFPYRFWLGKFKNCDPLNQQAKEYMTRRFKPSSQSNASSSNEIGKQDAYGTGPLGLEFWLHPQHFNHEGQVTVKCQAMIPKVYLAETRTHVIANQRLHNRADKVSRTVVLSYDLFLLIFLEWMYWNT